VVRGLTESEAVLLAVYFEEVFRAEAKSAREAMDQSNTPSSGGGWQTDFELSADDEEDEADE
jgi:hypothetical protein